MSIGPRSDRDSNGNRPRTKSNADDLYFIRAGNEALKIGRTCNLWNRLQKMQADNHEELDCLLRLPGRGGEEPFWHKAFADAHLRGEWFAWSPEVEKAVADLREGRDWWERLLPPFDMIAEATVEHLDDPEAFEDAYWQCVYDWRDAISEEIERLTE